jgi:plasmid rolling circle replication initiator protein Rep
MKENTDKGGLNQEGLIETRANGKAKPWRAKKIRGLIVADSFTRLDEPKRAERLKNCSTFLEFKKELESGKRFLSAANFCRERLCPMCQWRKSLKVFWEVSRSMDTIESEYDNLVPLFLTLTVRNCQSTELGSTLDTIFNGWGKFTEHWRVRKLVAGWFRALELTYNKKLDTFHPHIHAIILVDKSYFETESYMETQDWVHIWKVSLGVDYSPICDIRRVKNKKEKRKGIAEVAKYTIKDSDFITNDRDTTDHLVNILRKDFKGRRLYAFGGIMKKVINSFTTSKIEDDTIRNDVATIIEWFRWNFGLANYEKVGEHIPHD